jgi:hypothetical protein
MKLQDAVIMGRFSGLHTVNECILNIELHYWQVLPYSELSSEQKEFYNDIKAWEAGELELNWKYINAEVERQEKEFLEYCNTVQNQDCGLDYLELFH